MIDSCSLSSKTVLSPCQLVTASNLARLCAKREAELMINAEPNGQFEVMGLTIAAVMLSASFLESHINELLSDLEDGVRTVVNGSDLARIEIADERPLTKYDIALAISPHACFDKSQNPHQSASLLFTLRNVLVHYKPVWQTVYSGGEKPKWHSITAKLQPRFARSRLAPPTGDFWPYACLGAPCAKWAAESALAFADEFNERMGSAAPYESQRGTIVGSLVPATGQS